MLVPFRNVYLQDGKGPSGIRFFPIGFPAVYGYIKVGIAAEDDSTVNTENPARPYYNLVEYFPIYKILRVMQCRISSIHRVYVSELGM